MSLPLAKLAIMNSLEIQLLALTFWSIVFFSFYQSIENMLFSRQSELSGQVEVSLWTKSF